MSDRNAWDDSLLINSWNDAVKEYDKYHSIHKSGKRLEDALTEEELRELKADYGEDLEETETPSGPDAETNGHAEQADTDMTHAETGNIEAVNVHQENANPSQQQQGQPAGVEDPARQEAAPASAMTQALLGTVQDENMKNIMMSWYYAGYYTGLHAGQQQVPKSTPPNQ